MNNQTNFTNNNIQHDERSMDIENTSEEQNQRESSTYHMKSVKFYCEPCRREFSVLNPENSCGKCPRCDNVSRTLAHEYKKQQQPRSNPQQTQTQSGSRAQPTQPNSQQQQHQRGPLDFLQEMIFGPADQTVIVEPNLREHSQQQQQRTQPQPRQPQTQPQNQSQAQENQGSGFLNGLIGFGQNVLTNILGGLTDLALPPQQPQPRRQAQTVFIPFGSNQAYGNQFTSNPFDLFGDFYEQQQPQIQFIPQTIFFQQPRQAPRQHIVFEMNPFEMIFLQPGAQHIFFNAPPGANYERIIEEFLRNDPNNYGAAPASQEGINSLKEFDYAVGACKNVDCTVCQEDYKVGDKCVSLPCGHNYHKDCVVEWLKRHDSCPVCRKPISETLPDLHQTQRENSQTMNNEEPQAGF